VLLAAYSTVSTNEFTNRVLVVSDIPLHRSQAHPGNVDVPVVDVMSLRHRVDDPGVDSIAVDDLDFGEPDTLFESRRSRHARHYHQLDQLLAF